MLWCGHSFTGLRSSRGLQRPNRKLVLSTGSWELPGPRPACCTRYVNVSHTEGSARADHRHTEETVNQRMAAIAKFALGPSLSGGNTETEGEGGTRPKAKDVFSESRAGGMVV